MHLDIIFKRFIAVGGRFELFVGDHARVVDENVRSLLRVSAYSERSRPGANTTRTLAGHVLRRNQSTEYG